MNRYKIGRTFEYRVNGFFDKTNYNYVRTYGSTGPYDCFCWKPLAFKPDDILEVGPRYIIHVNKYIYIFRKCTVKFGNKLTTCTLFHYAKQSEQTQLINLDELYDAEGTPHELLLVQAKKNEGHMKLCNRIELTKYAEEIGATPLYGSNTPDKNKLYFIDLSLIYGKESAYRNRRSGLGWKNYCM